jgi:hypothetical protein
LYLLRQRWTVASETPYWRQTVTTGLPDSTSCRMRMVCSSV